MGGREGDILEGIEERVLDGTLFRYLIHIFVSRFFIRRINDGS